MISHKYMLVKPINWTKVYSQTRWAHWIPSVPWAGSICHRLVFSVLVPFLVCQFRRLLNLQEFHNHRLAWVTRGRPTATDWAAMVTPSPPSWKSVEARSERRLFFASTRYLETRKVNNNTWVFHLFPVSYGSKLKVWGQSYINRQ